MENLALEQKKKLNRMVAKALIWKPVFWGDKLVWVQGYGEGRFCWNDDDWNPIENWTQAGPIIEKESILVSVAQVKPRIYRARYQTDILNGKGAIGTSYLLAAMKCFVIANELDISDLSI